MRTNLGCRKPLAFHAVGFSEESVGSVHLERMTQIATETYDSAPPDPLLPAGVNPCSFHSALDTVCVLYLVHCRIAWEPTGRASTDLTA